MKEDEREAEILGWDGALHSEKLAWKLDRARLKRTVVYRQLLSKGSMLVFRSVTSLVLLPAGPKWRSRRREYSVGARTRLDRKLQTSTYMSQGQ